MTQPILGKPVDERTSSLGLPLPSLDNMQEDDVPRLRDALARLDALLAALQTGKAGAADLAALASELRGTLGLKAATKDLQDLAAELRAALGLKADASAVVKSWAGKKGDVAPVFADLGGRPDSLAGYGIQNFRADEGLPLDVNLCSIVTSGIYRYNTAADNPPGVLYSTLMVFRSVDTCCQMVVDYASGATFVRSGIIRNGLLTKADLAPGPPLWRRVAYQSERAVVTTGVMDFSLGMRFIVTVNGSVPLSFANVPPEAVSAVLEVHYIAGVFSLPAGSLWANGRVPEIAAGKRHLFYFEKCLIGNTGGWYVSAITGYVA